MDICIAPLAEGYSEALSAWQAGEKKRSSNYVGTHVIFPLASQFGVQEEYNPKVQDPQPQRPGSGIEKYGAKVQEDHSDQQSTVDEKSEMIVV